MKTVWHENKALVFTEDDAPEGYPALRIADYCDLNPANLLQKFDNNNTLYLICNDCERRFSEFCGMFAAVEAAGGVVENPADGILMIFRRGWWDLPKGHVEAGETHEETALREVEEETGLRGLSIRKPLGTTQHFYRMHGRWEMKRTWWYAMDCPDSGHPVPQTEEDITEVRWLKGAALWKAVGNSYGTIREVIREFLLSEGEDVKGKL